MIWPAMELQKQGHDVTVTMPASRDILVHLDHSGEVVSAKMPDTDVAVFQRITHRLMAKAIPFLQKQGVRIVVDVDDDLTSIHPSNPAWMALHPRNEPTTRHSWHYLQEVCKIADLVTVSAEGLIPVYGKHGRVRVVPNYLAEPYYEVSHQPLYPLGWPASVHSHPNDPESMGSALNRLGSYLYCFGERADTARAFGVQESKILQLPAVQNVYDWPAAISQFGLGIAPLADTQFNVSKSWLKPLELSAVGVPWVGSPSREYSRLHALGCGELAKDHKEWYRKVKALLEDEPRRKELSEAGRAVAETLRLRDHAWEWLDAWDTIS